MRTDSSADGKLRLLVLAYDFRPKLGGIATCAAELTRALALRDDVEVRVLAPASEDGSRDGAFDKTVAYSVRRVPLSARPELASLQLGFTLASEIRSYRPDAVLGFLWLPEGASAYFARKLAPATKVYLFAHGVEVLESDATLRKRIRKEFSPLKRRIFQSARAIFAVSHYTKGLVERECAVSSDRIRVVYNAVDSAVFSPGEKSSALIERYGLAGKRVFLSVTRLVDYKGIDHAIRAFSDIASEFANVVYLVAGDGPDRVRLEGIARTCGIIDRVRFTGAIVPGELVAHYRLADGFVLPSREDLVTPNVEGFGIVFLEAAACGVPSIAGRSGGVPDAVVDGETGWLVDPEDPRAIAAAMRACLADPGESEKRGARGRERVKRDFNWNQVAENVFTEISTHVRNQRNRA